jgi:hypothetical protein
MKLGMRCNQSSERSRLFANANVAKPRARCLHAAQTMHPTKQVPPRLVGMTVLV